MPTKSTDELENILGSTHISEASKYLTDNAASLLPADRPFAEYIRARIKEKKLLQQDVFLNADIPYRYGYKLISEEKHTRQRDIILRICYAAELTLDETQRALKIYGMNELYAKVPRDAVLMIIFNTRPGSIIKVNEYLVPNGCEPLRSSGVQE